MRDTNAPDPTAGLPTMTCRCVAGQWSCGNDYEFVGPEAALNDRDRMARLMAEHLNAHTRWHARVRDSGGVDVWCPGHRDDPACRASERAVLAAELRDVADRAGATLDCADPLDAPMPGTRTHTDLLLARATALAALAALAAYMTNDARARPRPLVMDRPIFDRHERP